MRGKIKQKEAYFAFIPTDFPQKELFKLPNQIAFKVAEAGRLIGKLDGVTHLLSDADFFLSMFVLKDATASSQIEGTKATIVNVLKVNARAPSKSADAFDIIYYEDALNYGMERLEKFPLSLRFIREIHQRLMTGACSTHYATLGEFRKTQNWVGGTKPEDARFVPVPANQMCKSLGDFEKFLHEKKIYFIAHLY